VTDSASEHPTSSPPTIIFQFSRPWNLLRPRLYRFMPSQFVDDFFRDGSLRLSSFAQFAKHPNEQLQDGQEGWGTRVGIGSGMTIMTHQGRGADCYVLCGTLNNTSAARALFMSDGCFAIDNIIAFANVVSTKIPFVGGLEGFAIYQDDNILTKSLQREHELSRQIQKSRRQNPEGRRHDPGHNEHGRRAGGVLHEAQSFRCGV
jgi:hypothetical protein